LIQYFNFILTEKTKKGGRTAYTMMDVLGDVGGSSGAISMVMAVLLTPFTYKLT
jgi:hypothetical protein